MCGIAGIVAREKLDSRDHRVISELEKQLDHRGPDSSGIYSDQHCSLVQTRLALVGSADLPLPLESSCGRFVIAYNGEIYGYEKLKIELSAYYRFLTETDTEVVLAAWIRWGPGALQHLDRMFAFFIWDRKLQRGFAARDPIGIKPFFLFHARWTLCVLFRGRNLNFQWSCKIFH